MSPIRNVIDDISFRIVVATLHQVCVFSFPSPTQHLFTFETRYNKYGLCEVTPLLSAEKHIVVFPSQKTGGVQLVVSHIDDYIHKLAIRSISILSLWICFKDLCSTDAGSSSAPVIINAHTSDLACLAINQKGTLIATASEKGTLIRVFDTIKRIQLHELRRGSDPAFLYW